MKPLLLSILFVLSSCSTAMKTDSKVTLGDLKDAQRLRIQTALEEFGDEKGHLAPLLHDCDGTIWTSKWCSTTGCSMESYHDGNGRWYRTPGKECWLRPKPKNRAASTCSRDMLICGALPYMYTFKRKDLITEHLEYLNDSSWYLGEPRTQEFRNTPQMMGTTAKLSDHLGGPKEKKRFIPGIYKSGLEDYHAHLQMCNIWLRGSMDGKIKQIQLERVIEHYNRIPEDPFFSTLYGLYTGDVAPAVHNCLKEEPYFGDYVRCGRGNERACGFAHTAFACKLLIDAYD